MTKLTQKPQEVRFARFYVDIDDNLRIIETGHSFCEISGFSQEEIDKGLYLYDLLKNDKEVTEKLLENALENIKNSKESIISLSLFKKDGSEIYVDCYTKKEPDSTSGHRILNFVISDVSGYRRLYNELEMLNQRYRIIDEFTDEIYFDYDVDTDSMLLPKKYMELLADKYDLNNYWSNDTPRHAIHPADYDQYREKWLKCLESPSSCVIEFRTRTFSKDGNYEWYRLPLSSIADETGRVVHAFGRLCPISKEKELSRQINSSEQVIEKLSTTDHLTGLYNKTTFKKLASEMLEKFHDSRTCAVIYSDINDFSYINDNFGFDKGNEVLCEFAKMITGEPEYSIPCRIYSDFFLAFVASESQDQTIKTVSLINNNFTNKLKEKYPASDIHISSGVYFFPKKGNRDITIAIDNANLARRSVKGSTDVPCGIYSESLRNKRRHDQTIASEIHAAIESGHIEMFLQPKFSLDNREIIGAEALARWKNPDGSYKLPFEFIDILEKVGYIIELDFCIYEKLLQTMQCWKNSGKKLYPISVNFSRLHTLKKDFVPNIIELAERYEIDKKLIEIEVTESAFAVDSKTMSSNLAKLRDAGFKIDIDDFGIGYSSLSMLMTAPIDTVKVDKLFIDNIVNSELEREYVKQICILISTTKKNVVFEGVESEEQANLLSEWGFSIAQGWLFDKAIPVKEFEEKYL